MRSSELVSNKRQGLEGYTESRSLAGFGQKDFFLGRKKKKKRIRQP
jgi:hypothetical protein